MDGVVNILSGLLVVAGIVGVIILVLVIIAIVYIVRRVMYAVRGEEYVPIIERKRKERPYEHQDIDAGSTAESVRNVLSRYTGVETVGAYARKAISNINDEERKAGYLFNVLDAKFERGSLSWEKFAVAGDSSRKAILRNCAALANRIQTFDYVEYRRLERADRNASHQRGEPLNATQQEKFTLMKSTLVDMDTLTGANARLLLELDKLAAELGKLADAGTNERSERIVEEIRTLIDETKYYSK